MESRITVVPHGNYCDSYPNHISRSNARKALHLSENTCAILFFGNIRPYKGAFELINAFHEIPVDSATLIVAGRPKNEGVLAQLQDISRGRCNIVLRPGFIAEDEVQLFMNAADVVVFPYQDVLTSGAVVLAMSFGRACIAPRIGCISDTLDERGAFLYDPNQPDGLRGALAQAVRSRESLAEMGFWNLTRARDWNWGKIADETSAVYSAALD